MKSSRPSGYRLYRNQNTRGATITVPIKMARVIPEDAVFDVELTEEGVLYRFRERADAEPTEPLPGWLREGSE